MDVILLRVRSRGILQAPHIVVDRAESVIVIAIKLQTEVVHIELFPLLLLLRRDSFNLALDNSTLEKMRTFGSVLVYFSNCYLCYEGRRRVLCFLFSIPSVAYF